MMYSTARQHSFTRVHVALKDKAHRVHAIVWQVTTGACGLAYCCPCPARHAGTTGEGPASAARVQNGSAAAKGCAPHPPPPPPPAHAPPRPSLCPSLGGPHRSKPCKTPASRPCSPFRPRTAHRRAAPFPPATTAPAIYAAPHQVAERQVGQTRPWALLPQAAPPTRMLTHWMETQPGHPRGRPESGRPLAGRPPPPSRHA